MPRVVHIPSGTSWSFPSEPAPVSWNLPPGNNGGSITLEAVTAGSSPVNGEGVIFTVTLDGGPGAFYTSACMENGTDIVPVPPGTLTIDVTVVRGCNGGADPTDANVSGAGV